MDFHSIRLEQRFVRAMETLMRRPDKSIWGAGENRAEAKAVCRMLGDEGFDRGEIIRARREAAIGRVAGHGGAILSARDAAGVNCHIRLKTEGMGRIGDKAPGVDVHSRLAAAADGLVFGVLDQSGYNRAETKDEPASREGEKVRPIEEEEGFRRPGDLERSATDIPVYELFAKAQSPREPALIRTARNRMTVENGRAPDGTRRKRRQGRVEATPLRDSRSGMRYCR